MESLCRYPARCHYPSRSRSRTTSFLHMANPHPSVPCCVESGASPHTSHPLFVACNPRMMWMLFPHMYHHPAYSWNLHLRDKPSRESTKAFHSHSHRSPFRAHTSSHSNPRSNGMQRPANHSPHQQQSAPAMSTGHPSHWRARSPDRYSLTIDPE